MVGAPCARRGQDEVDAAIAGAIDAGATEFLCRTPTTPGRSRASPIKLPATLEVTVRTADLAELACRIVGVQRAGTLDVRITDADPVELYRTFVTVVLLARAIAE